MGYYEQVSRFNFGMIKLSWSVRPVRRKQQQQQGYGLFSDSTNLFIYFYSGEKPAVGL